MPAFVRHEKLKARPQSEFQGTNKRRGHFHAGKVQTIGAAEALPQFVLKREKSGWELLDEIFG